MSSALEAVENLDFLAALTRVTAASFLIFSAVTSAAAAAWDGVVGSYVTMPLASGDGQPFALPLRNWTVVTSFAQTPRPPHTIYVYV